MFTCVRLFLISIAMGCVFSFICGGSCSARQPFSFIFRQPSPLDLLVATAEQMQSIMTSGTLCSYDIVRQCLDQVKQHDNYLKAMLAIAPGALNVARSLDRERQNGIIRGPLHGVPVLIKDNIETGSQLGMDTTAGSYALSGAESYGRASVVERLLQAGAVILGKAQLSEFAFYKGTGLPPGWSAVGGQCQSAYTTDDVALDDGIMGYSSPGGSSTGSAVGVSAGYAPIALGTDTTGSVMIPAARAALYALRFTTGTIPLDGVIPFSRTFDTLGIMAKSVSDLTNVVDIVTQSTSARPRGHMFNAKERKPWANLRVGVLAPEVWKLPSYAAKPNPEAERQLIDDTRNAYKRIKGLAKAFREVELISYEAVEGQGGLGIWDIFRADFQKDMDAYLQSLKSTKVRSVADIVKFNKEHADLELPAGYASQDLLEGALNYKLSQEDRQTVIASIRRNSTELGIDKTLEENDLDVILGPGDSGFNLLTCGGGYPAATMPLSYLHFNNRPTSVFAIARRHHEETLLEVMRSWEATFPSRKPPSRLRASK
ncbi:amidase signature domain-containing protein [Hypoxylon crocopeplum]|nr:amidase signature domain-containing protein [Hypoxylon crocopeplum]